MKILKKRGRGFTVIEIFIVFGIIVLLGMTAIPIYGNLQGQSQLITTKDFIIQAIRTTKQNAEARYHDFGHGIKFMPHSFVTYHGDSYATRNQEYDRLEEVGSAITLSTDIPNDEINFSKGLGEADNSGTIFLEHASGIGDTITAYNLIFNIAQAESDGKNNSSFLKFIYVSKDGFVREIDYYNYMPTAVSDKFEVTTSELLNANVLNNDIDRNNDGLVAIFYEKLPLELEYGILREFNEDGTILYEASSKEGKDKFQYRAYDGEKYSNYATVYITVTPEYNYPPVANDDEYKIPLKEILIENVLDNDTDQNNDDLYAIFDGEMPFELKYGIIHEFGEDGHFVYESFGKEGEDEFQYRAYDGEKYSEYATVYITVEGNHAPIANDDEFTTFYKEILKENVLDNDTDEDGDKLYAIFDEKLPLKLEYGILQKFDKDGTFVYEPTSKEGKDKFQYRAYDGEKYSEYATVYITIENNRAPVANDDECKVPPK
ncbi:hypothetical protein K8R66_04190, partial [bacterium]|nr:hypothetical protein [bacterium]